MMYWPNGGNIIPYGGEMPEIKAPESEWVHLVIHCDGTKGGTRVTWHGTDITSQVNLDFPESCPITERTPTPVCVECHGCGWGKTEFGKDTPCRNCYGRGR